MIQCDDHAGEKLRNKIAGSNSWVYLYHFIHCGFCVLYCLVCGKVKFYFCNFFLPQNVSDLHLIESADAKLADMKGRL